MDLDRGVRAGGIGGRVILLGDGTELNSDTGDHEIFDNEEEDKDLEQQVQRFPASDSEDGYNGLEMRNHRDITSGLHSGSQQPENGPSSTEEEKGEGAASQPPPLAQTDGLDAMDTSDQTPQGDADKASGNDAGPEVLPVTDSNKMVSDAETKKSE